MKTKQHRGKRKNKVNKTERLFGSTILPPIAPAVESIPELGLTCWNWVKILIRKRLYSGVVVAYRKWSDDKILALVIHETPRATKPYNKEITTEWVNIDSIQETTPAVIEEFLTIQNDLIRSYCQYVVARGKRLIVQEFERGIEKCQRSKVNHV